MHWELAGIENWWGSSAARNATPQASTSGRCSSRSFLTTRASRGSAVATGSRLSVAPSESAQPSLNRNFGRNIGACRSWPNRCLTRAKEDRERSTRRREHARRRHLRSWLHPILRELSFARAIAFFGRHLIPLVRPMAIMRNLKASASGPRAECLTDFSREGRSLLSVDDAGFAVRNGPASGGPGLVARCDWQLGWVTGGGGLGKAPAGE